MTRGFEQLWPRLDLRAGVVAFRSTLGLGTEILLVRRRNYHFWSIPKGKLMPGRELHETAAIEAREEAGVSGRVCPFALGSFRHLKATQRAGARPQVVEVVLFPLEVGDESIRWPEMALRERRWFRQDQMFEMVAETELREILTSFDPSHIRAKLLERQITDRSLPYRVQGFERLGRTRFEHFPDT